MLLADFFDYKNQLMDDLIHNEAIVKLLDVEGVSVENAEQLIYSRIFPCEYIPETVQDGYTFICCDVDVSRVNDKTFLTPVLSIWVFTHRSKLRLPEGGIRTDALCNEICKAIDGSHNYTLGELNLLSCRRFAPMTDFQGKMLTFVGKEFNRQYDANKQIPSNRKRAV